MPSVYPNNPLGLLLSGVSQTIFWFLSGAGHPKGIEFIAQPVIKNRGGCKPHHPGESSNYTVWLPHRATGPKLAFEEISGLGPDGFTHSVMPPGMPKKLQNACIGFNLENPRPGCDRELSGRQLHGPAYEFAHAYCGCRSTSLSLEFVLKVPHDVCYPAEPLRWGRYGPATATVKELLESEVTPAITSNGLPVYKGQIFARNQRMRIPSVLEQDESGREKRDHPAVLYDVVPAFRCGPCRRGQLCDPRGFVLIDEHQRSPLLPEHFSAGVCCHSPVEVTPVPAGAPKTGYD